MMSQDTARILTTRFFVFAGKRAIRLSVNLLSVLGLAACHPAPDSTVNTTPLSGRDIYLTRCTSCHQVDGGGIPKNCPPFQGSPRLAGPSEDLIRLMLLGQRGPLERDGKTYNGIMPSWRADLTDEQTAEVLNYLFTTWSPKSPKITAQQVAQERAATADSQLLPVRQ